MHYALNRGAHEQRLVEQGGDLQLRRQVLSGNADDSFDAGNDVQRGSFADFRNRHQHAAVAVLPYDVSLRREPVAHVRHIPYVDGRAVCGLDGQVVQLGNCPRRAVHLHVVFQRTDLGRARGQGQILDIHGVYVAAPCTVEIYVRRKFCPRSKTSCSGMVLLLSPSWMTGVEDAV